MLARIAHRAEHEGLSLQPGNNVGYYGPYERLLRGRELASIWSGCHAGLSTLGIEADGTIKGCPSLPTAAYAGGNLKVQSLAEILQTPPLTMNVEADTNHLWGFCRTCKYAELCRGGCSWTAHVFFDQRGNNPYCHHRSLMHARAGVRERLVQTRRAENLPFANGQFEIVQEAADAPWPADDSLRLLADSIRYPAHRGRWSNATKSCCQLTIC